MQNQVIVLQSWTNNSSLHNQ